MGSSSIGCRGQNSLEAESLQPNSPLGEWINDDEKVSYIFIQNKNENDKSNATIISLCLDLPQVDLLNFNFFMLDRKDRKAG